jgi:uncharacterized damage-inducible protein DinB
MAGVDMKEMLLEYLQKARDAMVWKLDGLSEYDARRPLTPTGTNLLGLVKHLAGVEIGYFGDTFGRPFEGPLPWPYDDSKPNEDMYARADESREMIVGLYRQAWAHADATISALSLEDTGRVPWWPPERGKQPLWRIMVHAIAETDRHAGQADIVREYIDGAAGLSADRSNLPDGDTAWWSDYYLEVEGEARKAAGLGPAAT